MNSDKTHKDKFAICIKTSDPDLLTPRMIYKVIPDDSAKKSNYVRIVDNEGEDYLYPAEFFLSVEFSSEVEHALSNVSKEEIESAYSNSVK